ncbi:A mating type homeodomain transcription factor [Trametes sanguinea]|nr:A mating type homeodomain transcription factor [Trametes sanguinea]
MGGSQAPVDATIFVLAVIMQLKNERIALKPILAAARRLQKLTERTPLSTCKLSAAPAHTLSLPLPESLVPKLLQLGVDPRPAERISQAVTRALLRLKDTLEANFRTRCQRNDSEAALLHDPTFCSTVLSAYVSIYHKAKLNWIAYIVDDCIPRLLRVQSAHWPQPSGSKPPTPARPMFNHSAVPILEDSFSINPFPSRLEKLELASRCRMEYRQIHVWFQNRRSRLRKEGIELKRPERKSALPEEVENIVTEVFFPSDQEEDGDDEALTMLTALSSASQKSLLLNIPAPAHAFPAPYPPLCADDPFPMDSRGPPFALPWLRTPTVKKSRSSAATDLDTLASMLSKLTLIDHRVELISSTRPSSGCRSASHCAIGFVTLCSRAPHPALVRWPSRGPRSLSTRRQIYGDESLSPKDAVAGAQNGPRSARRRRALPRRIPNHPPTSQPALDAQDVKRLSNHLVRESSRTSSLASCSSSSSGSDVDSPLPTPELSISDLPSLKGHLSSTSAVDDLSWLANSACLPWAQLDFTVDVEPQNTAFLSPTGALSEAWLSGASPLLPPL